MAIRQQRLVTSDCIFFYYLLAGCEGHTRKCKPKVFHKAQACEVCVENQGVVFPGTAQAPS